MGWEEGSQILAGQRVPAPPRLRLVPQPLTRPPPAPRRCGETASCTTGTAAPVSTGRAPRSCSWLCSCCWLAVGASRLAGTWPVALGGWGVLLPTSRSTGSGLVPLLPPYPPGETGNCPPRSEPGSRGNLQSLGQLLSEAERGGEGSVGPWVGWAAEPPCSPLASTPRSPSPLAASRGVELVNASALFLLLLLNLVLIGRQDRLKRREVERRLRGIIDQIQGEGPGGARTCRGAGAGVSGVG